MQDRSRPLALSSISPSLGRRTSVKVVDELRAEELQSDGGLPNSPPNFTYDRKDEVTVDDEVADDSDRGFEFEFVRREPAVTAEEIFCNGQIRPLYPYPLDLVVEGKAESETKSSVRQRRPALRKLMSEERNSASFMQSEVDDELSGVSQEAYCVWNPKLTEDLLRDPSSSSRSRIRIRIKSFGSSKRWNLRDFLVR